MGHNINAAGTLAEGGQQDLFAKLFSWAQIILFIYLILLAVGMIGAGFKWAAGGKEGAEQLFAFATNPFMGLIMGTMATALVQSSSTVTSVIVGLVAGGDDEHRRQRPGPRHRMGQGDLQPGLGCLRRRGAAARRAPCGEARA